MPEACIELRPFQAVPWEMSGRGQLLRPLPKERYGKAFARRWADALSAAA